jgi:SAM-dependent methyltransferase
MNLTEGEVQVLASISRIENDGRVADRAALDQRGERYWIFKEDWTGVCDALAEKGLIEGSESGWCLTEAGRPFGETYRAERADMYWYYYQRFYTAATASAAHSKLCLQAFGEDLTQEGQTDMASLKIALSALPLGPGKHALDLGCGAGMIAEYVSDETGAKVTGLDYSESAVAAAEARTASKRDRLSFRAANFNTMAAEPGTYDAILSLDTLYWASDLEVVLGVLADSLSHGGRMALFMNHHIDPGEPAERLEAAQSDLGRAVAAHGLNARALDFSANIGAFWERNYAAAVALRDQFEAEGNGFIAESLIRESEEDYLPDIHEGRIARYLFLIDVPG